MKANKLTVSIGIPAYNEEKNIKKLLAALLSLKTNKCTLERIIVVSDASDDNTNLEVKSVKNKLIKLVINKKRIGKARSQNKILDRVYSQILVILDADVLPTTNQFLSKIARPFLENKNIGLVGGKVVPIEATTFVEKIINYSVLLKEDLYLNINKGNNIYHCHGRVRAFSKNFYENFRWQPTLGEDAYSYLACKQKGFEFYYEPEASVLYRSPTFLTDHFKQSMRFSRSRRYLRNFYNKDLIDKEYPSYTKALFKNFIFYFLGNPILFFAYCCIFIITKIYPFFSTGEKTSWATSSSTKRL